ncbi:MAG: hypothetical protein QOH05_3773 [Acetobacteraceae bacterium]|jgi:hypothetical protein|nr:hypothetical protein [Acetobacteraceae bacterium]
MKKIILSALIALGVCGGVAQAQSYSHPAPPHQQGSHTGHV